MRTDKRQITRGRHGAPLPYPAVPMSTPRAWDCSALRNSWRALVALMSTGHIKLVERRGKERETRARPWERLVRERSSERNDKYDALLPMKGCCATMMQMALSLRRTMGTARQMVSKTTYTHKASSGCHGVGAIQRHKERESSESVPDRLASHKRGEKTARIPH
jgi:hypothetical protein